MKLPASLALAALLTACAGGPVGGGGNGPYAPPGGSTYERQVIAALSETKASPEQRAAVLAAFDKLGPALKENDAAERRLQRSWAALDPKSAGYAADADALGRRRPSDSRRSPSSTAASPPRSKAANGRGGRA